jgi:Phosphoserine phosphatase RsbU, N-terminal domain
VSDDALTRLRLDYRAAFVGFLSRRGETQLSAAYESGRRAITGGIGLLDVVQVHNSVTLDLLREARDADERLDIAEAAATFLVEVLAAADMTQRALLDRPQPPPA